MTASAKPSDDPLRAAASLPGPRLRAAQVESFRTAGFLAIDRLIDDPEVDRLRAAGDQIFAAAKLPSGDPRSHILYPSLHQAAYADNGALRAAKEIALRLCTGTVAVRRFDMLVDRRPGDPRFAEWHQDGAYSRGLFGRRKLSVSPSILHFWVALDDVDTENGCMHFVPGYGRGPLMKHVSPRGGDSAFALEDPRARLDLSCAVPCPLRAGGCLVHTPGAPHYCPPNRSADRRRRAYIFSLIVTSRWRGLLSRGAAEIRPLLRLGRP